MQPNQKQTKYTRRNFHASAIAGAVAMSQVADAAPAPSERITLGIIGCGSRGFNLLDDFLRLPECEIVAVCDVDELHHRDRPWGTGNKFGRTPAKDKVARAYQNANSNRSAKNVSAYSDYNDIINRSDIDAVVIATPDHWHAMCTLAALKNGKDVYCEKPVTHLFAEGQAVVASVKRHKAVFQTGSQQRSAPEFQSLVELCRNGVLGNITSVEVGLPAGYAKPMGSTEVMQPRQTLDYDFWCGPSQVLPLMQARHHRWWRGHRAYGGGVLMDWIGHHNDIAHWALGKERSGPVKVSAVDWTFPETEIYNSPHQYTIRCEFDDGVVSTISTRNKSGLKVIGSKGWVFANRGKLEASDPKWLEKSFDAGPWKIERNGTHAQNFLRCIKSRKECIAPAEIAHRSITPGHLGFVSNALQTALTWDPITETITGNADADSLLKSVNYRQPWKFDHSNA